MLKEKEEVNRALAKAKAKDIIEKIKYERGEIVRISKENAKLYETDTSKGLQYRIPPYKIRIKLKCD